MEAHQTIDTKVQSRLSRRIHKHQELKAELVIDFIIYYSKAVEDPTKT